MPVKSGLYSCPNNFPRELAVCHGKGVTLFLRQIIFFNSGALFARVLLHQNQSTGIHNGYSEQRKISQLNVVNMLIEAFDHLTFAMVFIDLHHVLPKQTNHVT